MKGLRNATTKLAGSVIFEKAKKRKMADNALKVFGTPERDLRRRLLHPNGLEQLEETDDGASDAIPV